MKKQAFNPYLPSYEYIPDGEPYVFGGRLYVYGSHDKFNGETFCMNDYVCWSAPIDNLGNWKYEGVIYRRGQDPLNKDNQQYLYAPDVQRGPDGRYYLFYVLNRSSVVSAAVCDTPAGEYQFYGHVKYSDDHILGSKPGEVNCFDPGIFVDDDGRVYLYIGFSPFGDLRKRMENCNRLIDGAYLVELEKDMLTIKKEPVMAAPGIDLSKGTPFEGHAFFEASSMRKINGRYYFIYSSELSHELCYAVSNRPDGGFEYGGTIVSNCDIGFNGNMIQANYSGNTHGSIIGINDKWYIFYHRQTNRHHFSRQGCAEQIQIKTDGSIAQVEMTSCGLNGGPLAGKGEYEARIACNLSGKDGACFTDNADNKHPCFTQSGVDRESEGDQYISNLRDGAWAGFKYFSFTESVSKITVKARGEAEGELIVSVKRNEEPAARIRIEAGAEWKEFSAPFKVPQGEYPLYFTYKGQGALDFSSFIIQ